MEKKSPRFQKNKIQSPKSSTSSNTNTNTIPITRSEPNNPYPTTFVQADTSSFKQVVQMLTGLTDTTRKPDPVRNTIPPIKSGLTKNKAGSKLYERRNSFRNFKISPLGPDMVPTRTGSCTGSPRPASVELLSPSILDFPSLVLSPVTPLIPDPFNRNGSGSKMDVELEAEEKAIKEKGFYLHKSPVSTPREMEPKLLPLFPVTSPRVVAESNS